MKGRIRPKVDLQTVPDQPIRLRKCSAATIARQPVSTHSVLLTSTFDDFDWVVGVFNHVVNGLLFSFPYD